MVEGVWVTWEIELSKKEILLWSLLNKCNSADIFNLAHQDPFRISDLQSYKIINLYKETKFAVLYYNSNRNPIE